MAGLVALTDIRHGNDDGSIVEIKQGESVSKLPKSVQDNLGDAIGEPPELVPAQAAELEAAQARVTELERLLEEAKAEKKA